MAILVGCLLAIGIGALATIVGWDRDRAFYPVVTFVVATYYVLFAAIGADSTILFLESTIAVIFLITAVVSFKKTLWIAMVALAAHGIFDLTRSAFISNPGVPIWWPGFCASFDIVIAIYLLWLLKSGKIREY